MDVKQKIISSVFNKRNPPETYVAHLKIWEDSEEGGRKPRYILMSSMLYIIMLIWRYVLTKTCRGRGWGGIYSQVKDECEHVVLGRENLEAA